VKLPVAPERCTESADERDERLLARFVAGDVDALAALLRRWEDATFRLAFRVTGDHGAAEDVRQEVFLRLIENPTALARVERFSPWIRRAVINAAINWLRARQRRQEHEARWRHGALRFDAADRSEERLEAGEEGEALRSAMLGLEPEDRALLALRFDEELTFAQISEALGRPLSTVKFRVERALQRLRSLLKLQ
jgi:RNA polymerase sigma-70 factor (ECF subfamily)